jgi:hypothetical protein
VDARNALEARPVEAHATKRHARSKPMYLPDGPLLVAAEAAAERRQALSTFWRDVAAGRVPPAYYVSPYVSPRCPRWRRSELLAALEDCRSSPKTGS